MDESVDPPLSVSVSQMIEDRYVEHQQRLLETEVFKAETRQLNHTAEVYKKDVSKLIELSSHALLRYMLFLFFSKLNRRPDKSFPEWFS